MLVGSPNIAILYSEVMPYTLGVIRELKRQSGCNVLLVYWDKAKLTPYTFDASVIDDAIPRSQTGFSKLTNQLQAFKPDLLWVSGRMDALYLKICLAYKGSIPVVMGCDNQWKGDWQDSIRQWLSRWLYRRHFSHCWVPGMPQYMFCRRMGFQHEAIITDLYSAASSFLEQPPRHTAAKRFLFVGRFAEVKNIHRLIAAFQAIPADMRDGWKLRLVGAGDISPFLTTPDPAIEVYPFESQDRLMEHAQESGVFVLPSTHEPWGVVVHEFAAMGMPLLLSQRVGAASAFLIDGYNGYSFDPLNVEQIRECLEKMIITDTSVLAEMGTRSRQLANRITPETAAANLLSIIG